MKREYLLAETLDERRIIAICAANRAWAKCERQGRFPSREFYKNFLGPFVEYERRKLQLDEIHHIKQRISKERERELAEAVSFWSKKCIEKLESV